MDAMKPEMITPVQKDQPTAEKPFFFYLSLVLIFIGAWTIYNTASLRAPLRLIPFITLMIIHIGLYWLAIPLVKGQRFIPAYLIGQGIIALAINLLGENSGLALGLFMGLIGLSVGIYNLSLRAFAYVAFFLLLSLYSFVRTMNWGDSFWWLMGFIPLTSFVVIYVILYNRQTEARERALRLAAELEQANQQLSQYAERVEALTLTNERQRMARELHDTLSQGLAGLILQLEAVDAHLAANNAERAHRIVQQAMVQARATLTGARRAIDDLRQTSINLTDAIRQETDRFTQSTSIPCQLNVEIHEAVPESLYEPAQRAVAEALMNITRHALATQVQVNIRGSSANGLEMSIEDNGVGFDPSAAIGQPGHYGLLGIRERSRLAGGIFEITANPGHGAKLYLRLPYPDQNLIESQGAKESHEQLA